MDPNPRDDMAESLSEREQEAFAGMLRRLHQFVDPARDVHQCMVCEEPVTAARKVGRCVYADPCGHRQFQGDVPSWATK